MDSERYKIRMNVEGDRLSYLPDDLIHKILSFMDIKYAIQTSALSSRWRNIWTSMPCLNFSSQDFHTFGKFSNFVTSVMSSRNSQIEVSSINLTFRGKVSQPFYKRILNIILNNDFTHNVQQLNITCSYVKRIELPLSLLSYQSLKHLTLVECIYKHPITTTPTWELPTLTTLNLRQVTFFVDDSHTTTDKYAGLFSNFVNLKNLTLKYCRTEELNAFIICHPGLSSLTLEDGHEGVYVVAPQLKNLTIKSWRGIHLVSAPKLSSFHYKVHCYYDDGHDPLQLFTDLLHLEKVDLCIQCHFENKEYVQKIVCLLQQLHGVKFLTLNWELVKLLSSSAELISHQPSPFVNLKSLKIYPADVKQPKVTMSTEVKNYLLDGSPDATIKMVSREEIRAVMDAASARNLMRELQMLLDEWKLESSETNTTHAQGEVEDHFGERMTHIERYWEDLNEQLVKGYKNTRQTISMLRKIEEVLKNVSSSDRAKLQARFSGLRAEAETIMDNVMDSMKIQWGKRPSRSNVFFHEFATSSQ